MHNDTPENHNTPEAIPSVDNADVPSEALKDAVRTELPKFMQYRDFRHPEEPVTGKEKPHTSWSLSVPMDRSDTEGMEAFGREFLAHMRSLEKEATGRQIQQAFNEVLHQDFGLVWRNNEYLGFFDRPEAELQQSITGDRGPMRIKPAAVSMEGGHLTGRNAILALENVFGLGRPRSVPLYASGFTVTIGNIRKSELTSLQASLIELGGEIGTGIHGRLFTGDNYKVVGQIVDFLLDHVITCTVAEWSPGNDIMLGQLLKVTDIPHLLCAGLQAIYPNKYPLTRRCKNTLIGKCDYKTELKLTKGDVDFTADTLVDFSKLPWTDRSRLTKAMIRHMEAGSRTREQIEEYQQTYMDAIPYSEMRIAGQDYDVRLLPTVPNYRDYIEAGERWIAEVDSHVDKLLSSFSGSVNERRKRRTDYIFQYRKVLKSQMEAAWIKNIQFIKQGGDDVSLVEDPEDVFDALSLFSEDETLYKTMLEQVTEYQENAYLTFTGIMNYVCPKCGEKQVDNKDARHNLIPLNLVSFFFMTAVTEWSVANII